MLSIVFRRALVRSRLYSVEAYRLVGRDHSSSSSVLLSMDPREGQNFSFSAEINESLLNAKPQSSFDNNLFLYIHTLTILYNTAMIYISYQICQKCMTQKRESEEIQYNVIYLVLNTNDQW